MHGFRYKGQPENSAEAARILVHAGPRFEENALVGARLGSSRLESQTKIIAFLVGYLSLLLLRVDSNPETIHG